MATSASEKTGPPEDPPPYTEKPLHTQPAVHTNMVVAEMGTGLPPAQVRCRRTPKKCKTVVLVVTVFVVLAVAVTILAVMLGKKRMMGGKPCDSGEEGRMGEDCNDRQGMGGEDGDGDGPENSSEHGGPGDDDRPTDSGEDGRDSSERPGSR